jgi:hypothetical protein
MRWFIWLVGMGSCLAQVCGQPAAPASGLDAPAALTGPGTGPTAAGPGLAGPEDLARRTELAVSALRRAPRGTHRELVSGGWHEFALEATWAEGLRQEGKAVQRGTPACIGVFRVRLGESGTTRTLTLEGVSTATGKEFATRWEATITNPGGDRFRGAATVRVRSEAAPALFTVTIPLVADPVPGTDLCTVEVSGKVQRLTAACNGQGAWIEFGSQP